MLIRRREQEIRRTQPRVFAASATISTLDRRTRNLPSSHAYLNANDLLACQEAARRMRGAGVLMPDGLIALAALRSDLLQAGQDSR